MALYEHIAEDLRQRISRGEWAAGERLPSQRELAQAAGTTLVTVRQAIKALADAGLLHVEHGSGTYVSDLGKGLELPLPSFGAVRLEGHGVTSRLLSIVGESQHEAAASALRLPPGSPLMVIERLRVFAERPAVYQRSYLSAKHYPKLRAYDGEQPLYVFLRERLKLTAMSAEESLTAVTLEAREAGLLDLPAGASAILSRKTSSTGDNRPFLYDEALINPTRLTVSVNRRGTAYSIRLKPAAETVA